MKIGFIFECGPEGPDFKVCRHLVQRLDPQIEFVPATLDDKRNLIEQCGAVAKSMFDQDCQKVIIVWDLFPPWREFRPCRREDRQNIFHSLQAEGIDLNRVALVCICEELEAWLLADNRAVETIIGRRKQPYTVGRIPRFKKPDSIKNPKKRLTKIFNQELGCRYVDYQDAHRIAANIPDFNRIRRSESFRRFALKVAGLQL
jgi:hypothetical protein